MKPAPFTLHPVEDVDEALELLGQYGDDAKVLAGGQSLVPMLALRLAGFPHLVDLNRVAELTGISSGSGFIRIGAMTRHREIERTPELRQALPLLTRATACVGHFQIRNRGTLGGAIAHADPAGEQPAVAVALDAVMEVAGKGGTRDVPARQFFESPWMTAVGSDEILTAVRLPVWPGRCGFGIEELTRRAGDFAIAGATCAVTVDDDGAAQRAAIALFGVAGTPVRASAAEQAVLAGETQIANLVADAINPSDDLHASGKHRRKIAGALAERAIRRALAEARGEDLGV